MSKYLIILMIVLVIGGLAYFSWSYISSFLSQKPAQQSIIGNLPPSTQPSQGFGGQAPTQGSKQGAILKAISDKPILDYWGNGIYIDQDGQVVDSSINAGEKVIGSQSIEDFHVLLSNKNTPKIIIGSGQASFRTWTIFDPTSNVSTLLGRGIESATWSPDGKKIAYLNENGDIFLRNTETKRQRDGETKVINLNQVDGGVFWFRPDYLEIISKPTNYAPSTWISLNLKTKSLNVMRDGVAGLMLNWSAENKLGLEFAAQNFSGVLNIINEKGDVLQTLSFLTVPQKCAWGKDVLYCAIARDTKPRMLWPDIYLERGFYSSDDIFRFDLKTGGVKQIWSKEDGDLDVWHMETRDNRLLFINRYDNQLYELNFQ